MEIWLKIFKWNINSEISTVPKGGSSAGAPGARPPVWNFLKIYFWKFRQRNTHKLYCYQHTMSIKIISRPQELYRAGTAPNGSKIPGSANGTDTYVAKLLCKSISCKITGQDRTWTLRNYTKGTREPKWLRMIRWLLYQVPTTMKSY